MDRTELFETTPVPKAVATLAIPTIISSLVMVIYNLADTYFVGMINDPVQTAAVTLAAPVMLAFNAVNNLFGVGSSSMMSRALGAKDHDLVARSSAFGFYCSLISGILFSLLCVVFRNPLLTLLGADEMTREATNQYMLWTVYIGAVPSILNVVMAYLVRAEGSSLHASIGAMSGCMLNILLDPIFILPWGLDMGAAGAGLATCISNCLACLYFFGFLFFKRGKTFVCVDPRKFGFKRNVVVGVCTVGIPASIQNLLNVTSQTLLNNFTAVYGASAVAAMGITRKVDMVPFQVAMGLSQGIMPLISYNYARGNAKRMKETFVYAARVIVSVLVVAAVVFFFGSETVIRMFMKNEEIVAYGAQFLKLACIGVPLLSIDFLAVGVFQAVGNGKMALFFAIMRKIILEIPALYILNWLFPLYGLACAATVSEGILSVIAIVVLIKLFRGWEKEFSEKNL